MNFSIRQLTALFLSVLLLQPAYSQEPKNTHTFKIIGSKRIMVYLPAQIEMRVEYDTASIDHLYITEYNPNGFRKTKTRLLFKGEKFNLERISKSIEKGELLMDGIQTDYKDNNSIGSELLYKEEKLQRSTFFYPNGNKQISFFGDEDTLNGQFKMWFPDGQLSFSGNYKNNIKDGEFLQFDQSGTVLKKGIYQEGKLISGVAVNQDVPVKSWPSLSFILTDQSLELKYEPAVSQLSERSDSVLTSISSDNLSEGAPEFPGGQLALRKFIAYNVRYPVLAQEKGITGKIFVGFIVEADGSITHVAVKKGVHPVLDEEAVRVVKLMPRWIPGTKDGKTVRVEYTVPVNFVIQ